MCMRESTHMRELDRFRRAENFDAMQRCKQQKREVMIWQVKMLDDDG